MAFQIGTANNSIDLWDKLIAFLTTDLTLVANDEAWSIAATYTGGTGGWPRVILSGPGASATDRIYVGLARTDSADTDGNNIRIVGMTGLIPDATAFNEHINVSPEVRIWLDASPMKYWFVASGRRFIVVVNMSTVYQAAYAGFFLPYANPLAYPYPMYIGGSSNSWSGTNGVTSWRSQSDYHAHFCYSPWNNYNSSVTPKERCNGYMLDPAGSWLAVSGLSSSADVTMGPRRFDTYDPDGADRWHNFNGYNYGTSQYRWGSEDARRRITQMYGGGFALMPFSLIQNRPSVQNYGILDGAYSCPGVGNGAENIVEIDSIEHLVVQNVWRTTTADYWALRLD